MGTGRFKVVSMKNTEFMLVLLFINYSISYLYYNCKPTPAHPCIMTLHERVKRCVPGAGEREAVQYTKRAWSNKN